MSKVFKTVCIVLLLLGTFVAFLPTLVMPDLIYPERIDSNYVLFQHERFRADEHQPEIYLTPADLNLVYEDVEVHADDSALLKGWYIPLNDTDAATLVIVHDVNESKLKYINLAKQMHDRGLKVFLYDLRAHGSSGGSHFSPGLLSANDLNAIIDTLESIPGTEHIVLMGIGIGAGIALQQAELDDRCAVLVVQSPFNNFSDYVDRYANRHWKGMRKFYSPVLNRKLVMILQHPTDELVLSEISRKISIPSFYIGASEDSITPFAECRIVFDSAASLEKDLILVKSATHDNIEFAGGEAYYNNISEFIIKSVPKKAKKVRYRRLT
jgi:uncharacterized protein